MAEYIERKAAYRFAQDQIKKETGAYSKGWNNALGVMKGAFHNNDAIPAADVVPVRHGRWMSGDMPTYGGYKCSVCGENTVHYKAKYCPNCGARMDGAT
jgi:hypothetical protein